MLLELVGSTEANACRIAGTTSFACTYTDTGPGISRHGLYESTSTLILTGAEAARYFVDATVVHDAISIFSTDAGPTTSAVSASGNPTATSGLAPSTTTTDTSPTETTPTSTTVTATEAVKASTSTGGMSQKTGGCAWTVGGVVAAVALAAL